MAQATVKLYFKKWAYVKKDSPSVVVDITGQERLKLSRNETSGILQYAYVGFNSLPSNLKRRRLYSVSALFAIKGPDSVGNGTRGFLNVSSADFNPSTLVWTNRPSGTGGLRLLSEIADHSGKQDRIFSIDGDVVSDVDRSNLTALILKSNAGFFYAAWDSGDILGAAHECYLYNTLVGGGLPYLEITYDNSISVKSKIVLRSGPTGGYVDPRNNTTFSWAFVKDDTYSCADENFGQASATLYWKESTVENYTAVSVSGSTQSVTIPANTFPTKKTIQWYVQGTDDGGTTTQTSVYSFSTSAPLVVSTPVKPINTIEDGRNEILFQWAFSSSDGRAPSRLFLYWREEGANTWQTLYNPGAGVIVTSYRAPADTFPAGTIEWGIQAANVDGAGGAVGTAKFINYASPTVSNVSAAAVPYTTVTWQASDQQAYQIKVDDVIYGPYFGTEKSFAIPDCLEDGEHIIGVSVVGTYGLWSEWEEHIIDVLNDPGEAVSLDSEACIDIKLFIDTQDAAKNFQIYRDGVQIAKTNKSVFTDRFALGEHTYKVVNKLENGNYTASNEVVRFSCVKNANIALLSGGEWLEIKYTLKSNSDPEYEDAVEITYNHLAGSDYPSAVISQYLDKKVNYSAVFLFNQADERKTFESMFKKPVIIKFADGTLFAGILDSWSKHPVKKYYTSYTFTVTRMDIEDYVDDTK